VHEHGNVELDAVFCVEWDVKPELGDSVISAWLGECASVTEQRQ